MPPSTTWQETPPPDEDARFARHAALLATLQQRNAAAGKPARALHAKGHGLLEASLAIHGGLPAEVSHGLFAKPATYEALVRFSNGAGKPQRDQVADVRGIAVKVLAVSGAKVLGDAASQDLLAILSSATPFRNADEFVAVVWGTRAPALALFRLVGALGLRAFPLLKKLVAGLKGSPGPLSAKRFFSALPIQCGPYAARFAFTPVPDADGDGALSSDPVAYATSLAARVARAPIAYDLALQLFVDEAQTPIEDASVDWPEAVAPYVTVGRLTIARQDLTSARGRTLAERGEQLSFDPWHALVEHKPLGGMMRARKHAYFASTQGRGAAAEPASIAALLAP